MNSVLSVFFTVINIISLYFGFIALFGFFSRKKPEEPVALRRFAVLIAARNEANCIEGLIESLQAQNYPRELIDIWVLPNNCTDDTASVAAAAGARVMTMPPEVRSKGTALHCAAERLMARCPGYDAFCVFDADNEADPDFIREMNRSLNRVPIAKSRILAKNREDSLIAACYDIYFCTANRMLNRAREKLGLSARVIGTGFAIRRDLLERLGGFPCRTMTEDAELYAACLQQGVRIGYCENAVTYDEEPLTFKESMIQRRRWMSGIAQVSAITLPGIGREFLFSPNMLRLDGMLQLAYPTLQAFSILLFPFALLTGNVFWEKLALSLPLAWLSGAALALIVLAAERRLSFDMLKAIAVYPLFMASFIPLQLLALFKRQTIWHETRHSGVRLFPQAQKHTA